MPAGVGYPPGQMSALAAQAREAQAIPQPGIPGLDVNAVLGRLRSGQLSAGALLQLLSLLAGMGGEVPGGVGVEGGAAGQYEQPQSPIDAAYGV